MKCAALQENLRRLLLARIANGGLTGVRLAEQAGFRQAHISNFLNRKRGLSVDGMDRVLEVQKLSVLDLLDPAAVARRATIPPPGDEQFDNVLLVESGVCASTAQVTREQVCDILKFKRNFLRRLRADTVGDRSHWTRFLLFKPDAHAANGMHPRLLPGATVLVDRHYNSLKPYRKDDRNMYAIRKRHDVTVRYVELVGGHLILRPHNDEYPVDVVPIERGKAYADVLIGRVCHVGIET